MAQRPMVDVQPFSGPMWDGAAAGLNLELAGESLPSVLGIHTQVGVFWMRDTTCF